MADTNTDSKILNLVLPCNLSSTNRGASFQMAKDEWRELIRNLDRQSLPYRHGISQPQKMPEFTHDFSLLI